MVTLTASVAAPASVSAGAATDASKLGPKTLFLFGTLVGSWQAQISPDGTNWSNEGAALSAAGSLLIEKPCVSVRWNCTAFTSGTPTSQVSGIAAMSANW